MDLYMSFIDKIVKMIPEIDVSNNIYFLYIGESVARGDYSVGISDIDIYFVIKQNDPIGKENVNMYIQEIANDQLHELLSWCPDGLLQCR